MGDTFNITDESGESRLTGLITDPGATSGDVLTVQDDGSIAAETGGGSLPDGWTVNDPAAGDLNANGGSLGLGGGGIDMGGGLIRSVAVSTPRLSTQTPTRLELYQPAPRFGHR